MYAVIETGGKQYRVQEGDKLFIEKLEVEAGETIDFDNVLLVSKDGELAVGSPYVESAKVKASVLANGKGPKVIHYFHQ